ncbi:MAG TPA: hypothetical protein VMR86_06705 [Myxococcota bacterium]|nr:hypothetical protein [Myxococcota bacterium]
MTSPRALAPTALCAALLCLGAAATARAQAYPLRIAIHGVQQKDVPNGSKAARVAISSADIFAGCVGTPPTKTQDLYVFLPDCTELGTASIDAIDVDTSNVIQEIGTVTFDVDNAVYTSTGFTTKRSAMPITFDIECTGGPNLLVSGIADVSYTPVDEIFFCAQTVKVRVTGLAAMPSGGVLVDDGSTFQLKKANPAVTLP